MVTDELSGTVTNEEVYAYLSRTTDLAREMVERLIWLEEVALLDSALFVLDMLRAAERQALDLQRAYLQESGDLSASQ